MLVKIYKEGPGYVENFDFEKEMRANLGIDPKIKQTPAKGVERCCATEREELIRLKIIHEILIDFIPHMSRRAKLVPGLKRHMGLLRWATQKVMVDMLGTVPREQQKQFLRCIVDSTFITGTRKVNRQREDDQFGTFVSFNQMNELLMALNEHCLVCPYDDWVHEQQCPLKKTLDALGTDVQHDGDCKYKYLRGE